MMGLAVGLLLRSPEFHSTKSLLAASRNRQHTWRGIRSLDMSIHRRIPLTVHCDSKPLTLLAEGLRVGHVHCAVLYLQAAV